MQTLTIVGKCDRTRYSVKIPLQHKIQSVAYRDQTLPPTVRHSKPAFPVPENARLNPTADPPDLKPDSEIAAFWFVRACYESFQRPVFYYYLPAETLVVFPPVMNDGDRIVIQFVDEEPNPN